MKPEDFNLENIIPKMHNTDIEFTNWNEQTAAELTLIRKIITAYINVAFDKEQKEKFIEMLKLQGINSPETNNPIS